MGAIQSWGGREKRLMLKLLHRNRNVKAESDTNPSAFLPSSRAAAAASFFRFSSSFTSLSWAWRTKTKTQNIKNLWVSILIFQAGLLVSQIQYEAMTVKRKKLRMTYVQLVNSGHTLASLRFSFSSFSWSWPPSAPLLVSMLCSCGLLCCSASGCFRPSSAATLDCFTSVMLKDKIHIRGRSQNKHVSWQIIHFCYFWIKAYAPKN